MSGYERGQAPLPGLEPPARGESALEVAARRTIAALHDDELVREQDAILCQLLMDLSGSVAAGTVAGKASAAAMAAAQLLATLDRLLPQPVEGGVDDEIRRLVDDLRAAGRGAAIRDPARPGTLD